MVLLFVIVAVVGVLFLSQRASTPALPPPPPQRPVTPPVQVQHVSAQAGVIQEVGQFTSLGLQSLFGSKESKDFVKYAMPVAVAIACINVYAGVVAVIIVYFIANFIDIGVAFNDFAHDSHQAGLDAYESQWHDTYAHFSSDVAATAERAGQSPDPAELDAAATAFADGFMSTLNYLRAWCAYCGGVWPNINSGGNQPTQGIVGARRAWLTGQYAGVVEPVYSQSLFDTMAAQGYFPAQVLQGPLSFQVMPIAFSQGKWGTAVLNIAPPDLKSAARVGTYTATLKAIHATYFRAGMLAANMGNMAASTVKGKGTGQSDLSSLAWYRDHGFFQGAVWQVRASNPPGLPDLALGCTLGDDKAYTVDGSSVHYTAVAPS